MEGFHLAEEPSYQGEEHLLKLLKGVTGVNTTLEMESDFYWGSFCSPAAPQVFCSVFQQT